MLLIRGTPLRGGGMKSAFFQPPLGEQEGRNFVPHFVPQVTTLLDGEAQKEHRDSQKEK